MAQNLHTPATSSAAQAPATPSAAQTMAAEERALKKELRTIIAMRQRKPALVSPATDQRARHLLDTWDDMPHAVKPQQLPKVVKEMYWRVRIDGKYGEALARLHDLEVDLFRLKYEDYLYLASAPQEGRDTSRQLATARGATPITPATTPPMPDPLPGLHEEALAFFTTQEWPDILKRLRKERPVGCCRHECECVESTTLFHLCQTLARLTSSSASTIVSTIGAYVERNRNGLVHSRVAECAAQGRAAELASILEEDLRNLDSAPRECQEHVPAMREAIFNAVARLFEVFDWGEEFERRLGLLVEADAQW